MINVTKSFLPPIDEYMSQVQRAYDNNWLTNRGELVVELEQELKKYLSIDNSQILCMNNGTVPLQIALKLLGNRGEIITTPFSYVATTTSILWESCKPVFVDIHPEFLTIDENKIEAAITSKTTCILATHVFGNPCNIDKIERIAEKNNLKVIYDAAHCFGVKYNGKSIFEYGDISSCSFHATKIFHTGEGGATFCKEKELFKKITLAHSFGHINDEHIQIGINGKMSELNAAMGLSVLKYADEIIEKRKQNFLVYEENLSHLFLTQRIRDKTDINFSYIPLIFKTEDELNHTIENLNNNNIYPRRYFYPSLNTLNYYKGQTNCPISEKIANSIICLPNYHDLSKSEIKSICDLIRLYR